MDVAQILQGLSYMVCSTKSPKCFAIGSFIIVLGILPLLYTDWNTEQILWSDWLRDSPYIGVRIGVWTGQRTNNINNALTQ